MKYFNQMVLLTGLLLFSCAKDKDSSTEKIIEEYYQVYNERQDFDKFLDFYADNIILEDMINGTRIVGKKNLKKFFDWTNPNFRKLTENNLVIVEKIVNRNSSVVKGYFTEFTWGNSEIESMHFTTILTFDESGQIIKQVDWINYPSTLLNCDDRKNSNEWIN